MRCEIYKNMFYKNRYTHFWICFGAYKSNGGFDSQQYYLPFTGDRNSGSPRNKQYIIILLSIGVSKNG